MQTLSTNIAHSLVVAAAKLTGVKQSRIYGTCRTTRVVSIRWAIFIVLRRLGWSLTEIGDAFGKDHATVLHGLPKAAALLDKDRWFSALVSTLTKSVA